MERSVSLTTLATVTALVTAASPLVVPQSSGVTVRLRGVSAVNRNVAWASGANGTVVRTIDAGQTWQALPVAGAETLDLRDVDAVDENVAYALSIGPGPSSRIYKTTDGGRHWILQFTNREENAFFDAMAFWDAGHGIAISDSVDGQFVMVQTADGGRTWTRIPPGRLPPALPNEGAFAASGTNVAVHGTDDVWVGTGAAAAARVLRSRDRGRTWHVSTTPLPAGPSAGIFSVAFRDATHGFIAGGDYKKEGEAIDNAAITSDGGETWRVVRGLSGFRSAVAYVPRTSPPALIAVGPSGVDYSADEGQTWIALKSEGYHAVSFGRRDAVGWAAGEKGRIARVDGLGAR